MLNLILAATISIFWSHPPDTQWPHYRIKYGTSPTTMTQEKTTTALSVTLADVAPGTWCFAVQGYNATAASDYTAPICTDVKKNQTPVISKVSVTN